MGPGGAWRPSCEAPACPPGPDSNEVCNFRALSGVISNMFRTLQGWWRNATDALGLMWTEPLSWIILVAAGAWILFELRQAGRLQPLRALAIAGLGVWMVSALAITVYPLDYLQGPALYRFDVQSVVPLWGTAESIANSGDHLMPEAHWMAERERLARDAGVPVEEINLDRRVRGVGLAQALKDPIGNVVLFLPLGFLAALGWEQLRDPRRALLAGAAVSGAIELSQLLFGLGSLGTVDDVIFNSLGALIGWAAWSAIFDLTRSVRASLR